MKKTYFFIVLFGLLSNVLLLQGQSARKIAIEADKQYVQGNYFGAMFLYQSALEELPDVIQLRYKYAEACRLAYSYDRALDSYLKVLMDNERRYPQAVFHSATILKMQGFYSEALRRFRYFYKTYPSDSLAKQARQEILLCTWAEKQNEDLDSSVTLQLLADSVNTPLFEYGALETKRGMMFSAIQSTDTVDQFAKVFSTDTSIHIQKLKQQINQFRLHVTDITITADEREAFFSVCSETNGQYFCRLFNSRWIDTAWSTPLPLPEAINYPLSNSTQPDVSQCGDSLLLFFASDRAGGKGGLDLWYAFRFKDQFITIKNAGSDVNTEFDDITPQYSESDSVLYFSSLGHGGFGGYDVFQSHGSPWHFSVPQNMKRPINSSYNDLYFNKTVNSQFGFVTSNRRTVLIEDIPVNFNDVYRVTLPKPIQNTALATQQNVKNESIKNIQKAIQDIGTVQLYFDVAQPTILSDTCNYARLSDMFLSRKAYYLKKARQRAIQINKDYSQTELDNFFVNDIELGRDRFSSLCVSLQRLATENASATIIITAFTSPEGDTIQNAQLAQRRAMCIFNCLRSVGDGMLIKYLGKQLQVVIQNTDELSDRQINNSTPAYEYNPWATRSFFKRRVEVQVRLK